MKDYPQQTALGIQNPGEIEKFFINSVSRNDILRVVHAGESILEELEALQEVVAVRLERMKQRVQE